MQLFRNKKAMNIAAIIGGIITFIVLMVAYNGLYSATSDTLDQSMACRQLIGSKKLNQDLTDGRINLINKRCVTINEVLPGDHKVTNSEHIKKLFADEIKNSWWMVHEGSVEAMWDEDLWRVLDAPEECIILKSIIYEDKGKTFQINKSDFQAFLLQETAKEDDYGNSWTYYEYVQNYGSNPASLILVPDTTSISNLKDYTGWTALIYGVGPALLIEELPDSMTTSVSGGEIYVENYLTPGYKYAVAIQSGGGMLTDVEGDKNYVFFGLKKDLEELGCRDSIPDEEIA